MARTHESKVARHGRRGDDFQPTGGLVDDPHSRAATLLGCVTSAVTDLLQEAEEDGLGEEPTPTPTLGLNPSRN